MKASNLIGYDGCFATRLRDLMKKAKVTQQDLAASVGTTRQAISQYADGSVQPNIEKLYKIAEFFHVSADYLLGISGIATWDVDLKAINRKTGLSEKAIGRLVQQKMGINIFLNENKDKQYKDTTELLFDYAKKEHFVDTLVINLLLEEEVNLYDDVLTLLGDFFMHQRSKDRGAAYVLSEGTLKDGDEVEIKEIENNIILNDSDILTIRLLKLQQALIRYKNELNERNSNGDK